jgi:hypothetical protein
MVWLLGIAYVWEDGGKDAGAGGSKHSHAVTVDSCLCVC